MIDEAIGLYALPPGEFVAARNRLAKLLKADGRENESTMVGALKRPRLGEYALNRLAHEHGPIAEQLADAVDAATAAQAAAITGDASMLRDATAALRAAAKLAIDSAVQLLDADGASGDGQRDEITALVRAMSTTGTASLRLGVVGSGLVDAATDDEVFGAAASGLAPTAVKATRPAQQGARRRPSGTTTTAAIAPNPAERARRIRLERAVKEAQAQVDRAEQSVAEATEHLRQAEEKLDQRVAVRDARRQALTAAEAALREAHPPA